MDPTKNPVKKKDSLEKNNPPRQMSSSGGGSGGGSGSGGPSGGRRGSGAGPNDNYLEELIDDVLLGQELDYDDRGGGFELEALLELDSPSVGPTVDMRQYDERDYQSHRRESFPHTHQPLRLHHSHSQRRRTSSTSTNKTDVPSTIELEAFVSPIIPVPILSPVLSPYSDLSGVSPKKVQFEIGGSSAFMQDSEEAQEPHDKKKHHRRHHHHTRYADPSWRIRQGSETLHSPHPQFAPLSFELNADSMDDLDLENLSTHRFSDNKGYRRHKISSKLAVEDVGLTTVPKPVYDHQPHEIFVELDVLQGQGENRQWKEAARWIKYEEDVLEGSDRWGRPHVASLSFHSLINLRKLIETGVTLLDLEERDLPGVAYRAVEAMVVQELIRPDERSMVMRALLLKHKHVNENEGWKFNLRRNTTTSGSLSSLNAILEHHHHNRGLGGTNHHNTVPDLVNGGGGLVSPTPGGKMTRRNSAASRLTNDFSGQGQGHEGILIEDDSFAPLTGAPQRQGETGEFTKMSLSNLSEEEVRWVLNKENLLRRIPVGAEGSIVLVGKDDRLEKPILAFVRLAESSYMPNVTEVPIPVRFVYILLGPSSFDLDYTEVGRSISTLMSNTHFHEIAYKAHDRRDMLKGIHEFLDESIVLPPGDWDNELFPFEEMKEKREMLRKRKDKEKRRQSSIGGRALGGVGGGGGGGGDDGDGDDSSPHKKRPPPFNPLKPTKRLFGGMRNDVRHRFKLYLSDLIDGFNFQCISTICFVYFACIAGAIAFGGILATKTENHIGITETLISTAAAGVVFSLLSGQPLIIVGTTGPLLLFDESLYRICKSNEIDFLAFRFWIGVWVVVIGVVVVSFDGSAIARFFSRFVQEIFASLISLLFIYDALFNIVKVYHDHPLRHSYGHCNRNSTEIVELNSYPYPNTALLSTLLTFGTFGIAYTLRATRTSTYFTLGIRKVLGNFAVPIAIVAMVGLDYGLKEMTRTKKLEVPDGLTNTKHRTSWLVEVLPASISVGMAFLALVPAALVFILMFMETCICALIIGKKEHKLKKGGGYHLDIFLICVINGGLACIGGCWVCAATVRAVAHASSLIVFSTNNPPGEKPSVVGVKEQRVSNLIIAFLVGISVLMSPILVLIPMSVLFGVFLYMGISSMTGIQFLERVTLLFKQVNNHPQVPYVLLVKTSKMHLFTFIQILCLGTLFAVKFTPGALAIPFLLILLVPLRWFGLKAAFKPTELRALDDTGEDADEDDNNNDRKPSMEKLSLMSNTPSNQSNGGGGHLEWDNKEDKTASLNNFIDMSESNGGMGGTASTTSTTTTTTPNGDSYQDKVHDDKKAS